MTKPTNPKQLPWCTYPTSADIHLHGALDLPKNLPLVDFVSAQKFRSLKYSSIPLNRFNSSQILDLAHIIASSFASNEPMNRHVHPSSEIPKGLVNVKHQDVMGKDPFGPWTTENILFWFVRLVLLTDPSHPIGVIGMNEDLMRHSLLITNDNSKPIGGSLNITLPYKEEEWRKNDLFIDATFLYQNPIVEFIHNHEHAAIQVLNDKYPDFKNAHQSGKIGYIAMIARSPALPAEETFELIAASFESFQRKGYKYIVITGTNQWTGAACEALGAARIYFAPFRDKKRVAKETDANSHEPFSIDGFISGKDSGLMIYAVKL